MVCHGKKAAEVLTGRLQGITIHRRMITSHDLQVDLHMRLMEKDLGTEMFPAEYVNILGVELGQLPGRVYDEMVSVFLRQMTGMNHTAAARLAFCHIFPEDQELYSSVVCTDMFQLLRHYMSKLVTSFVTSFDFDY